jgi:NTP pyrophosphatase (non-canonical NTP hydrolase)
MSRFSNKLTDVEVERLSLLLEELGEAQQAIGKIMRHGYESGWQGSNNRDDLTDELGQVLFAIDLLAANGDVEQSELCEYRECKSESVKRFLHYKHKMPKLPGKS